MAVSRKHFQSLADALRGATPLFGIGTDPEVMRARVAQHRADIEAVANALAGMNERFDRGRFYRAAWHDAGIDHLTPDPAEIRREATR